MRGGTIDLLTRWWFFGQFLICSPKVGEMIPFDLRVFFNNHPTKIHQKNHQQPFQKTYLHLLTGGMTVILPYLSQKNAPFLFFKGQHISPLCSSFHRLPISWLHLPRRLLRCRSAQRLCKGRCSFSLRKKTDGGGGRISRVNNQYIWQSVGSAGVCTVGGNGKWEEQKEACFVSSKQIFPRWCWKLAMRRDGEFCSTPRSPSNPVATNDCFFGTQVDILVPWCFFTNLMRKMTESPRRKMIPNDDWWFRNVHWWFVVDDGWLFVFVMMQMMDVDDDVDDVDDVDDGWKRGLPLTRWIFRVGVYVFPGLSWLRTVLLELGCAVGQDLSCAT